MPSTNFVAFTSPINADWLNEVDAATFDGTAVYTPAGTGAVPTTMQAKFRESVSRSDYDTVGNFNTAAVGKPNIDGSGNFDAPVTPTSEATQIQLASALSPVIGQQRAKLLYQSGTSVQVFTPAQLVMGGFRFAGSYKKGRAPLVSSGVDGSTVVSISTDLGAESAVKADNWYGVFACANTGDAAITFKLMPFLRASSVAGSVVTLNFGGAGAGAFTPTAATYTFTTNNLANVDCLVINELSGGLNRFSGRTTTITANTTTTITLDSIGTVGAFDFLLPAPPGYTNYCYLGSFYVDVASAVTNIADSGTAVSFLGSTTADPNYVTSGALANVKVRLGGYVSPLATGVTLRVYENISTASVGSFGLDLSHDSSSHTIAELYTYKEGTEGNYPVTHLYSLNFSQMQAMWLTTIGSLAASRGSCSLQVYGYLEP